MLCALSDEPCSRARIATATAMALVATFVLASPAAGQQPIVEPSSAEAETALDDAEEALDGDRSAAAPDASVALNNLAGSYAELDGADRDRARSLLARPTDGAADQYRDGYPPGAPVASAESPHFCVFWVNDQGYDDAPSLTDSNGNGVPDYVESILAIAEASYSVEVTAGAMGWQPPKPDRTGCGSDASAHADLYLKQLGAEGLFGYESPDPGQGRARSQYGYMVLDDDYAQSEYGYADPAVPASVTIAHEFNHLLQQRYDSFQDVWMFESTAVWAEEQVFPDVNDWLNYLPAFTKTPGSPITEAKAGKGLKIYASGVWNHWLERGAGLGRAVIRRAWEVSEIANPADFAVASYDRAIDDRGGTGFEREFVRFAATTAEWRTGAGNFPDAAAYPDVKREGALSRGGSKRIRLDHTAYRLLDVRARGGTIELTARAEDGVRCGIALVARDGDPLTGAVVFKRAYLSKGGKHTVSLDHAGRYERITAAIVNADGRVRGFSGKDWVYSKDGARFDLTLRG